MRRRLLRTAVTALVTLLVAGAGLFVAGEFYNLTAIRQHPKWVYWALDTGRGIIVGTAAEDVAVPAGFVPEADPAGVALYQKHCAHCHGAPGMPPAEFALGMMPVPPNMAAAARERPPEQIYWFIRNGLKMSGMPAWHLRMSEPDMWRVTATVEAMEALSPAEWSELLAASEAPRDAAVPVTAVEERPAVLGDPERGRVAMQQYACRSCHLIPGLVGKPELHVGPPLGEAAARRYIAGVLPNEPENMVRWIMAPQEIDPLSAMPDLQVPEAVAVDMAAYLYTLAPPPEQPVAGGPEPDPAPLTEASALHLD